MEQNIPQDIQDKANELFPKMPIDVEKMYTSKWRECYIRGRMDERAAETMGEFGTRVYSQGYVDGAAEHKVTANDISEFFAWVEKHTTKSVKSLYAYNGVAKTIQELYKIFRSIIHNEK